MDGRWRMEVRVEGKCGPVVKNVDEALRQVQQQLKDQQKQWVTQLRDHPAKFADLEARIHQTFQGLADQVVAGVLAQATAADDFAEDEKKSNRPGTTEATFSRETIAQGAPVGRFVVVGDDAVLCARTTDGQWAWPRGRRRVSGVWRVGHSERQQSSPGA